MKYMIERLGDIDGKTYHNTIDEALNQLAFEYPIKDGERYTPDPEDDRILIWERPDTEPDKVVWHFSGWHWDAEEFGIPQGKLPHDDKSLYELANY
jgi:hypothetical protein